MTADDLPTQFIDQLEQVRDASRRITEMADALDNVDEELRRTGNLAAINLDILKTASERTLTSLDELLATEGLFDRLGAAAESTIAAINDSTTALTAEVSVAAKTATDAASNADERMKIAVARLDEATMQIPRIAAAFDDRLRALGEVSTEMRQSTEEAVKRAANGPASNATSLNARIELVAPSAVAAVVIAATLTTQSTAAAILASLIVTAGVIGGASWSRLVASVNALRSRWSS
jgi:hypothetical protein